VLKIRDRFKQRKDSARLKRDLGLGEIVSISTGAMLSGLFILPGLAFAKAGPGLLGSYIIAGLLAMMGMLSQAELSSAMPRSGGAYFFVSRSLGPAVGTVYGLITWLSLCLKSAMELLAIAVFSESFFTTNPHLLAVLLCLAFLSLNLIGIKEAGRIQSILVAVIITAIIYYVVTGISFVSVIHFEPFLPMGLKGMLSAAGFIFVSFGGLLKIASIAEEVDRPGKVIPKGMIISLFITSLVYLSVIFVTTGVLSPGILRGSLTPVSTGAEAFMGEHGNAIFSLIAILAILSAANAGIMASSRYPLALSRDGLFPELFGKINKRFNTPHVSVLVTGSLVIVSLFMQLEIVVKAASSVLILTYIFSCISTMVMRESRVQNYQPEFMSPLYPWLQILGTIGLTLLLLEMGKVSLLTTLILSIIGTIFYVYRKDIGKKREFALMHLIERITARELTSYSLEEELKEIIIERDEIFTDQFDEIIKKCVVLDLDKSMTKEEFFGLMAREMSKRMVIDAGYLQELLIKREAEGSTVLSPYLAVPHIIIEGEKKLDILVARSRQGIVFSQDTQAVHAVFVLIGTKDMRHMHLCSLAAIAQVVQDPNFETRWMEARSIDAIKDVILLTKRRRSCTFP